MPTKTLIPVDLAQQEAAQAALAQARKLDTDAEMTLLHVIPRIPEYYATNIPEEVLKNHRDNAEKELREFAQKQGDVDKTKIALRGGSAGREILNYAEEIKADLIVVASHDPGWGDFLMGSVAAFVVRHAHCSVLVVRTPGGQ